MSRQIVLFLLVGLAGCPTEPQTPSPDTPVCDVEPAACPECFDGDVECTYEGVSVTEASCGGCQAEEALFVALCDAGSTATFAEVVAGRSCVTLDGT